MVASPHPPNLRQKPGSLKQSPCGLFSCQWWTLLMSWFNKLNTRSGHVYPTDVGQSVILTVFKLATPKLGEEKALRVTLKMK